VLASVKLAPRLVASVFRNPDLRRVELAYAGFNGAEWAVWLAMLVYAYDRGGATTAGVVAMVQLLPSVFLAPLGAVLGDRYRPGRVLVAGYLSQSAAMGATAAVLLADGPPLAAYTGAVVASTAFSLSRPSQAALVPGLVRSAEELTATNVVSGWVESMSVLVAPALTGVLLAVNGPGLVFLVGACAVLISAILVAPLPGPFPAEFGRVAEAATAAFLTAVVVVVRSRPTRLLLLLLGGQYLAIGGLDVLYPLLAHQVIGRGDSWAGYLNAAFGLGGAIGILATAQLVGRARLMPPLLLGVVAWMASFLGMASGAGAVGLLALLALGGVGRELVDVSGHTLLQRVAPSDLIARVFGIVEGLAALALALGAILVPVLVAIGGSTLALVGVGLVLPLLALTAGRSLRSIDADAVVAVVEISLLRSLTLFAPLDAPQLESLAGSLVKIEAQAGTEIARQGEVGDRFYVVASGTVEAVQDGRTIRTLQRGQGFGEIALLHDVPRTATCRAVEPSTLYALDKESFLSALTRHPAARTAAEDMARDRLLAPGPAPA
jgi:MFS family permease